ncbi:MAG: SIS domain-containing protein [Candidatus Eremiobacteraeota bacterium]|nr:SIS domain-containing protein [Candidatus Eremiobacteraeota bacterium]
MLGARFEAEIREQPEVWRRLAASAKADELARAIGTRQVCFVGSGSSLFAGQLGALALRRRGIWASALAATETRFDREAYREACVVALSQSGRSGDVLAALDLLAPRKTIAITNAPDSPLAARADRSIALDAGPERAVPATKSVTATVAILLWAAALIAGHRNRTAATLRETADDVERWLGGEGWQEASAAALRIAYRRAVAIVGAGYSVPIAFELALKMKEASYVHAEGFAAGEFRHGSSAMLDSSCALIGILDESSREIVARPMLEAERAGALRYVVGAPLGEIPRLGPSTGEAFNTLGWLVTGQSLALFAGRAAHVDGDAPRGLSKFLA